jgi:hypothetical protein
VLEFLTNIWNSYNDVLKDQPILAGAMTLYSMGIATYFLKSLPFTILDFIKNRFLVKVTLHSNDRLFSYFSDWLDEDKIFQCRNFIAEFDMFSNRTEYGVATKIGLGNHLVFYKGRPFLIFRSEKDLDNSQDRKESIAITTFGMTPSRIRTLIAITVPPPELKSNIDIFDSNLNGWRLVGNTDNRTLESVALKDSSALALSSHIDRFINSRDWYKQHGIPYRTGILLEGPPGTGKTSTALALCSLYGATLYTLNLSGHTDSSLNHIMSIVQGKAIILIEDIDAFTLTQERGGSETESSISKQLTLSGLLNAIDGVTGSGGRILIATTNHIEKLDKALIRPGRFEMILKIDNMDSEVCRKMFKKFYPDFILPDNFNPRQGISPAQFQCLAIANRDSPEALLEFCQSLSD